VPQRARRRLAAILTDCAASRVGALQTPEIVLDEDDGASSAYLRDIGDGLRKVAGGLRHNRCRTANMRNVLLAILPFSFTRPQGPYDRQAGMRTWAGHHPFWCSR
jgi:hypothetical protein